MTALEWATRCVEDAAEAVAFAGGDHGIDATALGEVALYQALSAQQRAIEELLAVVRDLLPEAVAP